MNTYIPLVTVLMPVYNGEKYLGEAIESILNQTFIDFEFLIIDDGSTDSSVDITKSYDDDRIRLIINQKNLGQSATLNKGIDLAVGKYIARMDQDDVSFARRLQRQVQFLKKNPHICVVGSWVDRHDEYNRTKGRIKLPMNKVHECGFWIFGYGENVFSHPTVMFRTKEIVALGGYEEDYDIAQDVDLWFRAAERGFRFTNIPEVLLSYRIHSGQGSKNSKTHEEHNKALARSMSRILLQDLDSLEAARLRPCNFSGKYFSNEDQVDRMLQLKKFLLEVYFKEYNPSIVETLECVYLLWKSLSQLCQLKFIGGSKMVLKNTTYCLSIILSEIIRNLRT